KQTQENPWSTVQSRFPVNESVKGKVSKVADFGAFVELAPGVEGLIHISELSTGRVRAVGDVAKEDQPVQATVLSVDESGHRMSLSIGKLASAAGQSPDDSDQSGELGKSSKAKRPKRTRPLKGGLD
ncbi:MAG: S1 RNA-binding domain-containing protein, partial [Phycisphaerae bacterium]|nr:S1 RNA-binding domain-containing protein [Phycisphaerae bacterium]